MPDPNRLLSALAQSGVSVELKTLDVCYLAALKWRAADEERVSFSEEVLFDVFEQVCDALGSAAETRRRATHAIRRLREQRMLARVDGAGAARAGEYALTRLATGIVDFVLEDEALTRESLAVLLRSLLSGLSAIAADARDAATPAAWTSAVAMPLRVAIGDLVAGIQRRQRGFDLQQEQLRRDMAALLRADWFGAVERCQELLEGASATLRELCQLLLRDVHELHAVLQQIQELAFAAGAAEAEAAARDVAANLDRVVVWGTERQRTWSEHYQYVQRFLRDVVLLDPSRTLTLRLREALAGQVGRSYALVVAAAPPLAILREAAMPPPPRPPVRRRRPEDDGEATDPSTPDEEATAPIETHVRRALAGGATGLGEVTERVLEAVPEGERYLAAGRVAAVVARSAHVDARAERPWREVRPALLVEDWVVSERP